MQCPHCEAASYQFNGDVHFEVAVPQLDNPRNAKYYLVHVLMDYSCPGCGTELQTRTVFKCKNEGQEVFRNLDSVFG